MGDKCSNLLKKKKHTECGGDGNDISNIGSDSDRSGVLVAST